MKTLTLTEKLRKAIEASGRSHNELARATGIPQPTISRFMAGADMMMSTAEILAAELDLELVKRGGSRNKTSRLT